MSAIRMAWSPPATVHLRGRGFVPRDVKKGHPGMHDYDMPVNGPRDKAVEPPDEDVDQQRRAGISVGQLFLHLPPGAAFGQLVPPRENAPAPEPLASKCNLHEHRRRKCNERPARWRPDDDRPGRAGLRNSIIRNAARAHDRRRDLAAGGDDAAPSHRTGENGVDKPRSEPSPEW